MAKKLTEEEKKALLNQAVKNINSGKAFSGKTGQQAAKDYAQKHNIQPKAHRATAAKSSAGKTASRSSGKASGGSRGAAKSAGGKSAPGIPQYLRPKLTRASLINEPLHPVLRAKIHSRPVQRASGGFSSRTPAATREGLQLPSVPGTTMRSRMADFDQLTKNSVDWHFADDARKQELFNQNELIRQRYGLKFDPHSGDTFSGNVNLSASVMPEVEKQRDYDKQNPLSVIGHNTGAGLAGISGGAYKTLDFLLPDVITPKSVQKYINKAKSDADEIQNKVRDYDYARGGKVGGLAGDLYQNAIGMIPQAVMAYLTAGASEVSSIGGAADDVLSRISSTLAKNTSAMTSFASTVGSDYENAKANGASDAEAAVSAILSSAASAGIETAGGIEAGRRTGSRLKNALQTGFEEGTEEVAQGLSTAATEKLVYDQDRKMFGEGGVVDPARMGQEFLAGNVLGGFFGGASKPDSRVETSPEKVNDEIDVRSAWRDNSTPALPQKITPLLTVGQVTQNPMYGGSNGVSAGRGRFNTAEDVGILYGGTRGRLYPNLPGRASDVQTPDVMYAAQNGQVSAELPTGLLPEGRSTRTKIAERVERTVTIPRLRAIDDAGNTNGGLTERQLGLTQALFDAQQKSGVSVQDIADEIITPAEQQYAAVLNGTEQYMRHYKGQGIVVVGTDEYGRGGYRASQNEPWYSDFYTQNGHAPRKSEIPALAKSVVDGEIARGGGQFVSPEFAAEYKQAEDVRAAAEALGSNALSVRNTPQGLQISYGTPARTADIRDTNAGRSFVSPAEQGVGAAPLNPMRGNPVDAANNTADAAYRAQIDGVFDGTLKTDRQIIIGKTPAILQELGAPDLPLTMTQNTARKIAYPKGYMGGNHNLGISALKDLPAQLSDPLAVIQSKTQPDSFVVLTEWNDTNGNPVIAAIHMNKRGVIEDVNALASAYGKRNLEALLGEAHENVIYTKENKSIDQILDSRLQLPELLSDDTLVAYSIAQKQQNNNTANRNPVQPDSSVGAAQSGFDPYTQMANEYGTIQPGENPARIVDVPRSTDGSDKVRQFARTAMEAKVTPDEMIPAFEQQVQNGLFSYRPKKDKPSLDMAVKMIDQLGIEGALARWDDVTSGRRAAGKEDIVLAELLYSKAAQMGDTQTTMKLAAEIAAEGTRAGQTVQALRLLKRTTPEGKLYYIRKTVQNIQDGLTQKRGKNAPQITIDDAMAQNLLNAQTEADADKAIDAIYDDVAKQIPPTFGDRLSAWRYFAMLGNPRTHIRNVVGNMVMQLPVRASNKLSASLQGAFLKDPEQRTRSLKRAKGAKEFAKADFEQMKNVLSGNAYTSEMSEIQQRQRLFPRPLQAVMDVNTNALDAEDAFFKKMTYINSLADFLSARGVDLNNVPADVLEQGRTHAIEDAKKATFQDASALADKLSEWENTNKFTKLGIGGFLPFKRTPINIVKRGFEYSPAGLIKGLTADLKKVRNGTMDATEAIDHIAQGLTGTAIAALGYFLASNDLLSASEPENDKEREFGAAQGSQEYALNIGDYSYTIDWAAPAALPLFVGAEFYNALTQKYDGEEQAFNQAMDSLSRLFEPMINMTMLSGVGSTIQSAQYSNTNPIFAVGENIVQNYAGQVVPTLLGQIARTADDTRRTTYVDKDSWVPDSVQKFMQRQANKIPGLSKMQPAYTDVWGREDRTESVALRAFENFLSPSYINKRKTTDAEKALQALYDATGDTAVLPSKPQKSYTIEGVKHNLSANEWLKLTNEKGKISLDAVDALTKSAAYQAMSDAEKVSAVKDVYDYAAAVAANSTYGKELEGANKTVHESKIDPGLYFAYKEMQDTLNETLESYEARDAVFQTIRDDSSLSDYQKNQLYHTLLMKGTSQSQFEKYQAISDKVTAAEYVDAMIQSQAIKAYGDELEEGRATAEATEFSYYLDQMGYTGEKRDALANTFKFYNMFPAKPQNYTFDMMRENGSQAERENVGAIESSGISAAQYMQIKTLASGATWEKGKSGAKLAAYGKIVSENTANYDQYAAVMRAMGYKNISNAYTGSGTLPDAADMTSQVSRSNTLSETGINPVAAGEGVRMGSGYGYRDAPTAGASTFHEGNDIPAPMGTPVVAYKSGTVSYVGDSGSGGNMVQIDHPDGTKSVYLHLQDGSFAVKAGDKVGQGQQIAKVGNTGISTGPHLDFRIMVDGKYVDPKGYYPGY
ncbi:peptidoglycan DD-metalloendopeptidase family protein [Agathobaculum desmolans]|uniref:peptidoglycan DD-metalloendopeptidase family protein n=1 Tax=Agathobaculum desmolans TaxID=39484 RepID=UPI0004E190A4|nr:peptidoglycan DD-metalloendopeptidase family protein [Agathobaculum desmolans]